MKKIKATAEQIALAHKYHIPDEQAHTINLEKVRAYERNPHIKLHKFLDNLDERRLQSIKKQNLMVPIRFMTEESK